MEFLVLGPLEVWSGDRSLALGGVRQRRVLAALLLSPNRLVPVSRLIEAARCYRRALDLFRELGDRPQEADSHVHIGDTYRAAGDPAAARASWLLALEVFEEVGHPSADEVRTRLRQLGDG